MADLVAVRGLWVAVVLVVGVGVGAELLVTVKLISHIPTVRKHIPAKSSSRSEYPKAEERKRLAASDKELLANAEQQRHRFANWGLVARQPKEALEFEAHADIPVFQWSIPPSTVVDEAGPGHRQRIIVVYVHVMVVSC